MIKRMNRTSRTRDGFTLMEVLLVLAILVILGGISVGLYSGVQKSANISAAKAQVDLFLDNCRLYQQAMGYPPGSLQDLRIAPSDADASKWAGPYIDRDPPYMDPWGMEYVYVPQGRIPDQPDIYSVGPDRQEGTQDDIGSW
ncbi:MAG: type II secretion system protein GspG [Planctomycetota bacterium]|nr:type II secretion system protein GspG [Planctomycetota bacterium]